MNAKYIAEWYDDSSVSDDGFEPDMSCSTECDCLEDAKYTAETEATKHGVQSWASVLVLPYDNRKDRTQFVNELDGAGWHVKE